MHHVTRLIVAHIINYSNTQHSATANDKFSKPASKTAAYIYICGMPDTHVHILPRSSDARPHSSQSTVTQAPCASQHSHTECCLEPAQLQPHTARRALQHPACCAMKSNQIRPSPHTHTHTHTRTPETFCKDEICCFLCELEQRGRPLARKRKEFFSCIALQAKSSFCFLVKRLEHG
jgi:hypothetical protein